MFKETSQDLYDILPIAISINDFSLVKKYFDELKLLGVTDLRSHLLAQENMREEVFKLIKMVKLESVNKKHFALYGVSVEQYSTLLPLILESYDDKIAEGYLEQFNALFRGELYYEIEMPPHKTVSGVTKNTLSHIQVASGHEKDLSKVFLFYMDITEKKQNDKLLLETEVFKANQKLIKDNLQYVSNLIESLPIPLFVKDSELRYSLCNKRFEDFIGQEKSEIIGKTTHDIAPHQLSLKYEAMDKALLKSGRNQTYESQVKNAQGQISDVVFFKTVLQSEEGTIQGIVGTFLDLTDLKKLEDEKVKLRNQLYHQEKLASIGTLAAGVAHEINNPLMVILNLSELAKENCDAVCPNDKPQYLEKIKIASKRILAIVNKLRNYSRQDSDLIEEVDVHSCIGSTLYLIEKIYEKENIQIKTDLQATNSKLISNTGKIQQVILNILTNAKDALQETKSPVIQITTRNQGEQLQIEISDNGRGIPKELCSKVFDPFFTTKEVGKGTGLGLSISHQIILELGGEIKVESTLGAGSTFKILIPES